MTQRPPSTGGTGSCRRVSRCCYGPCHRGAGRVDQSALSGGAGRGVRRSDDCQMLASIACAYAIANVDAHNLFDARFVDILSGKNAEAAVDRRDRFVS